VEFLKKKILFLRDSVKIARDKWKHFFVGLAMGIVLQASMRFLFPERLILETVVAFMLVIIISYGFELFSKFTGKGHYDIYDAVAGTIGGILGMVIILTIELHAFS
jgi:glycopeptide antibiotics resistance protein